MHRVWFCDIHWPIVLVDNIVGGLTLAEINSAELFRIIGEQHFKIEMLIGELRKQQEINAAMQRSAQADQKGNQDGEASTDRKG